MLNGSLSGDRLRNWWENTRSSLWFIPAVMAAIAILLSIIIPEIDRRFLRDTDAFRRVLFYGSPSAARTILTVIAGSLVTVISLTFSITLLTLQQASTQFTPRIMRAFMRHPLNQAVLGAYIATFLYAILVLRQVRDEAMTLTPFVPILATTMAIVLALVCLGLLVVFLNHSALMLNAATVVENIHADLIASIERLHPAPDEEQEVHTDEGLPAFRERHAAPSVEVRARQAGFLRVVDDDRIAALLSPGSWAIVHPIPGDYVIRGTLLLEVGAGEAPLDDEGALRDCFILGSERSLTNDALFAVRQLADVALKGMSPAIFDPTTAEHAISGLGDALAYLSHRVFPDRVRVFERGDDAAVVIWLGGPEFGDYVREAFSQLRHVVRDDIHVALHLLATLEVVARHAGSARRGPVLREIEEMVGQIDQSSLSPGDGVWLRQRAEAILALAETPAS